MNEKLNIKEVFRGIQNYFSPKVIGEVNDVYVKLAKIKGDKVPWLKHENEDELFYVVKGALLFEIKDEPSFVMKEGDLFIVPKDTMHRVSAKNECQIILIENKETLHTGTTKSDITKSIDAQKY